MKLQQLRYLCAIVDNGYVISAAAKELNTSQPGISHQIRLLEQELKTTILERNKTQIAGLTKDGAAVVEVARRIIDDADKLALMGRGRETSHQPQLNVITTQLHAGFLLPSILQAYRARYPNVAVNIMQDHFETTCAIVAASNSHIGVVNRVPGSRWNLTQMPCFETPRVIVCRRDHPLCDLTRPTLEQVVPYPIITYSASFSGGKAVRRAFELAGLKPTICVEATETALIKDYARLGFGIGILPKMTVDPVADDLHVIEADHLFGRVLGTIVLNPNIRMQAYMRVFIDLLRNETSRAGLDVPDRRWPTRRSLPLKATVAV